MGANWIQSPLIEFLWHVPCTVDINSEYMHQKQQQHQVNTKTHYELMSTKKLCAILATVVGCSILDGLINRILLLIFDMLSYVQKRAKPICL